MIEIIGILAAGIIAGRILRMYSWPAKFAGLVAVTVCALIFVLGYSVGAGTTSGTAMLPVVGEAISLTLLGLSGSFAGVWFLKRFLMKKS